MKHLFTFLPLIFFVTSCSIIGGPNGYFPEKKYDFLEEEIEEEIEIEKWAVEAEEWWEESKKTLLNLVDDQIQANQEEIILLVDDQIQENQEEIILLVDEVVAKKI